MPQAPSATRSRTPVDQDLQQLYNDVLAGFDTEGPSLSLKEGSDLDQIYRVYGDAPSNGNGNLDAGTGRDPYASAWFTPVSPTSSHSYPSPTSSRPSAVRKLPPTPGTSSAATSPTASFPMPEPEPYTFDPSTRPSHYSTDSYASVHSSSSSSMRKKVAPPATAGGRRLPVTPGQTSGAAAYYRPSLPGLPSDPRPSGSHALPNYPSSSSVNATYPPEKVPYHTENGSYSSGYSPTASRTSHDPGGHPISPQVNVYNADGRRAVNNGHHYSQSGSAITQEYSPYDHSSSQSLGVVPTLTKSPSREYFAPQPEPSPSQTESLSPYNDAQLARSTSSSSQLAYYTSAPAVASTSNHNLSTGGSSTYAASSAYVPGLSPNEDSFVTAPTQIQNYGDAEPSRRADILRNPSDMLRTLADFENPEVAAFQDEGEDFWEGDEEEDESRYINYFLLSHIAMQLRDKIPRGTHVKGSIPYSRAFTGKDIVSTIQTLIQRDLAINYNMSTNDRRVALQVARSLQNQLFFFEVEWGGRILQDGVEDVFMFYDEQEGGSDAIFEREELPTGVVTMLTRCYSPSCADSGAEGPPCYSFSCPKRQKDLPGFTTLSALNEAPIEDKKDSWTKGIDENVLAALPQSEIERQSIIHQLINKEEQYIQDLDTVETVFIKQLRAAKPPVLPEHQLEEFIDDVFGNILDLRECNRRLLEVLYVRQREQGPIIQRIGDIFLNAAVEFRLAYPTYIGHHMAAEKRLNEEKEKNGNFRFFLEERTAKTGRQGESIRPDLKHLLNRPSDHLQKYPVLLDAILEKTEEENPDVEFLQEAIQTIKSLHSFAQLRTFQAAMGKGAPGKWEWHDLVSGEFMKTLQKKEVKRQAVIFELIKGEMAYVKDLENIKIMYVDPLRSAMPPIVPRDRLEQFIDDVFHNYWDLYEHHRRLLDKFHEIQREEHPRVTSITAAMFDAALNFRDAYLEYIPNYPIAAYRIDDEMANNPAFKTFVDQQTRHSDAHRLDMKNFINRPIPRLLRYELLLKDIMHNSPEGHEDHADIPNVVDAIKSLGKETEPGVQDAKTKVELWRYNANLVFKHGETFDMDLLDPKRQLVHSGKLLRQPDGGLEWSGWSELFVLLFDNYLVMTKPKEKDGVIKYSVYKRPIPLDLLTLVNFTEPPTQRGAGLLRGLRGGEKSDKNETLNSSASPDTATDSRFVYPMTLHHNGRAGGPYMMYAETSQSRSEWQGKLAHALAMHKAVQESNKVFEIETLSADTFLVPSMTTAASGPAWSQDNAFTGKVTCSVPFNTSDGRRLVAVGCAEGVWIGFRHDPRSLRRVLHLRQVTQCAMLDEFGIFLVLADKSLFAYHIEALVPSSPHLAHQNVPQKLNGNKDVHFFSVGTLHGRTLIVYMKKKNMDSIFRVLEPVGDKINERVKAPVGLGSRLGFRSTKSEWFRVYRDFFLPSESYDLIFLKARIAILCAKGFEIMDLNDFNSVTIPQREDPRLGHLAKRCESCRPMEFGVYVDKHGDPSRSAGTIEWEGTAERVALHHPYILLFDTRFIEVRHIETGRLAQIIPGNDIRCIWDGRGVSSNLSLPATTSQDMGQEAQVHAVMTNPDQGPISGPRAKTIAQCVFELIPTVPLYPPAPPPKSESQPPAHTNGSYYAPPAPMSSQPTHYVHPSNSWRS
ncbi:hypothetical protein D9756_002193 [Leucocoprinus leucothites]|uniref:Uncharacterized protein n=1 Tax=Leucocoprinus leucothites TaxID=201217 RepID=A0A8H5GCQ6_9AGAR|nr:hypothetical protein D9756_002193 [Leucoagaricus leucothites]